MEYRIRYKNKNFDVMGTLSSKTGNGNETVGNGDYLVITERNVCEVWLRVELKK